MLVLGKEKCQPHKMLERRTSEFLKLRPRTTQTVIGGSRARSSLEKRRTTIKKGGAKLYRA